MKKIFFALVAVTVFNLRAQQSLLITNITNSPTGIYTVANNAVLNFTVKANLTREEDFNIQNISASTKSYSVKRYDVKLNPGAAASATAHLCFAGGCFPYTTYTAGPVVLTPGQSATALNSATSTNNELTTDLDEGDKAGYSVVKYTFYNMAVLSDSSQITLVYNASLSGIQTNEMSFGNIYLFPNPANDFTEIKLFSQSDTDTKLCVFNLLGTTILTKEINLVRGENNLPLTTAKFQSGIYFINISQENYSVTKKLVIE